MSGPSFELKDHIVRAGAGAGKTRGLVEKITEVFRHFQARGESPRIVLTTFTRKATQELKERLILKACAERDAALLQFVSDPSRLHISTIHGLLNVFLRKVGHLAGMDSGFQIVSEADGGRLARSALRELVVENPERLSWLEVYGFERLLRMCRRFEDACRGFGQLMPADTADLEAAAADEAGKWKTLLAGLAEEIRAEVPEEAWQSYAEALGGFARGWSGDPAALERLPSKPRRSKKQAEWEDWHARVDEVVKEFKKEAERPCWDRGHWPEMARAWSEFHALGRDFVARMDRIKVARASYLMSDLEFKAIAILREKPFLAEVFAADWDFWMIDEYQDTSPLQVECLNALIAKKPRYLVGDPGQSIYLFRGAEVRVFAEAERAVRAAGGEALELRRNYRSAPDLLLFINDFMASCSPAFTPMEPRETPAPATTIGGPRVCASLLRAADRAAELEAVASRVGVLLAGGARLDQICVLGRTHNNLMEVSRALKAYGYPTHVHSSRGFASRREVIDAQALWKFLVNPHDNRNLLVLLRSPWFYVEDWRLAGFMSERPASLWRSLLRLPESESPESVQRLIRAQAAAEALGLVRAFEETLCSAAFLDLSLVNDPAGRKESNLWKLIARARELEKHGGLSALDLLEAGPGGDLLDSAEGDATSAQEPDCINLMTIHGAKGLEFEHVILPCMGDSPRTSSTAPLEVSSGRFHFPVWTEAEGEFTSSPLDHLSVRRQARRELEEFDRWLYVALTRAKFSLALIWSERGRESWAARSPWFEQAEGRHQRGAYAYELAESWPAPVAFAGGARSAPEVRPPCGAADVSEVERRSVTDVLAEPGRTPEPAGVPELMRRWSAQAMGTRLHRRFEALRYRREGAEVADEIAVWVLGLTDPPMAELVREGQAEWGFQLRTRCGVLEGQIDLWGEVNGTLHVVDYKTGSPERREQAFRQLEVYAWALRRFGHRAPIQMTVIYPLAREAESRSFSSGSFARWEAEFGGA